jgi:hypothetical protein
MAIFINWAMRLMNFMMMPPAWMFIAAAVSWLSQIEAYLIN